MKPNAAQYTDVRHDDLHDDAMTDVSVSLLSEDDKQCWKQADIEGGRKRCRCARACAALRRWRWLLDTALLLVIVGLLVERRYNLQTPAYDKRLEPVGDLTGFAPKCKLEHSPLHTFRTCN